MRRKRIISLLILLLIPVSLFAAENDPVVAQVNGTPIAQSKLYGAYQRLIPLNMFHRKVTSEVKNRLLRKALHELIDKELKLQEAQRLGISLPEEDLETAVKELIARYPSREAYRARLMKLKVSEKEVREALKRRKLTEKVYKHEVTDQIRVDEATARKFYDENKKQFIQPEQLHLRKIIIKVPALSTPEVVKQLKEKATRVMKEIRQGLPFEEAARKYSDANNKNRGGDMGFIHKGRFDPKIEKEVLAGKPGQLFGPYKLFEGYTILKLEEVKPERLVPFEEIKDKLVEDLIRRKTNERSEAWMKQLRKKAKIKILDSRLMEEKPGKEAAKDAKGNLE
ncbi:MAG: hypothetical protein GXP58_03305 [Deltaproteobacteria bacterium]|nr:hypothetical protein [Deltaproteobacteria bacterium]